jgi:hypothetical protein
MSIDNTKKSGRLLQSRRYTHDTLSDFQEAFTSTLDINAGDIYIDQSLIPTSSLPFSGSGQHLATYSGSLKYYYRQALTKSDLNNEVWFFLVPSASSAGIGAQIITGSQQTNFISPKYAAPTVFNNTEGTPPGYGVAVYVSTNPTTPAAGDIYSTANYAFDYKTGVLQFSSSAVAPTAGQYVYMSAYQYIGRTLSSITTPTGVVSASYALTASYVSGGAADWNTLANKPAGIVSSSTQINTGSFSGSFIGSLTGTGSWAVSASYVLPTGLPNGIVSSSIQVTTFLPTGVVSSSTQINTGSFTGSFTGTLIGTGSWATSASYAITSSLAINNIVTASVSNTTITFTKGDNTQFSVTVAQSGSVSTASYATLAASAFTASYVDYPNIANKPTLISSSTQINTGSFTGSFTGTLTGTGSWATNAISSSFATTASAATSITFTPTTASFATTASYALNAIATLPSGLISSSAQVTASLVGTTINPSIVSASTVSASALHVTTLATVKGPLELQKTSTPSPINANSAYWFVSGANNNFGQDLYYTHNGDTNRMDWFEGMLGSSLLYGGIVSWSAANIYVSSGSGLIVNHNVSTGSEASPTITYIQWPSQSAAISGISTRQVTYLYIDTTGTIQQQTTPFTPEQYYQYIPLGAVGHFDYANVTAFGGSVTTHYNQIQQTNTFIDAFGPLKLSGYTITAQPSSLRLSVGLGKGFIHGGFYKQNPKLPSVIDTTAVVTASMARVYRSGSNGNIKFDTNGGAMYTVTDPSLYDNGTGILAAVGNSDWTIQRVFTDPVTNTLYVYYGQNKYDTYLNAVAAVNTDPFTEGVATQEFTIFAGYIIAKGNETSLASADSMVAQAGLFRNTSGASTGAGAATTALDQLTDVSIISPSNGQALVYNAGVWSNATVSTSSFATTASYVTYANVANKPTLVSSSTQINTGSFTGSFIGIFSGSTFGTASWASNATSASFATTASAATSITFTPSTASFATTASYAVSASVANQFDGYVNFPTGLDVTGSFVVTGSASITGSVSATAGFTGSLFGSSSYALSASYAPGSSATFPYTGNAVISGSLNTSGSITASAGFSGTLFGTASFATTTVTASYFSGSVSFPNGLIITGSLVATSVSASIITSSNINLVGLADTINVNKVLVLETATGKIFTTSSVGTGGGSGNGFPFVGTALITGSLIVSSSGINVIGAGITGSLSGSATSATSASFATTSSYAVSASYAPGSSATFPYTGNAVISGSLNTSGSITASAGFSGTLFGTASYANSFSGYINFPTGLDVTGSLTVSGSATITGSISATAGFTGSLFGSSSYALSASYAPGSSATFPYTGNAVISGSLNTSGSITASAGFSGTLFGTASYATSAATASYFSGSISFPNGLTMTGSLNVSGSITASAGFSGTLFGSSSYATTSSYALSASYAPGGSATFPYTGAAVITGSLTITGSGINVISGSVSASAVRISGRADTALVLTDGNGSSIIDTIGTSLRLRSQGGNGIYTNGSGWYPEANNTLELGGSLGGPSVWKSIAGTIITASIISASSGITGSLFGSSSYALSASYAPGSSATFPYTGDAAITGSLTISGSRNGGLIISGANTSASLLVTNGTIIGVIIPSNNASALRIGTTTNADVGIMVNNSQAFTFNASMLYPGSPYNLGGPSNRWGALTVNNIFSSGSITHTGSLDILSGSITVTNGAITSSLFGTSSWATNTVSSSFATTASYALNATATLPAGVVSSSTQFTSLTAPFTGSFTGSFKGDGTGLTGVTATAFPYSGSAVITGSLTVTGSKDGVIIISGSDSSASLLVSAGGLLGGIIPTVGYGSSLSIGTLSNHNVSIRINGGYYYTFSPTALAPADSTFNLGSNGNRWGTGYFNNINSTGSITHTGSLNILSGSINVTNGAITASNVNLVNISNTTNANSVLVLETSTGKIFTTSSVGTGGGSTFPYTGNAVITGSLTVTGSILLNSGSNQSPQLAMTSDGGGVKFNVIATGGSDILNFFNTNVGTVTLAGSYLAPYGTGGGVSLGTSNNRWGTGYFNNINSTGSITHTGSLNILSGSINVTNGGITSSLFGTASYAVSASYAPGGSATFPYTGAAVISGSLTITGSAGLNVTGPATVVGAFQATTKSFKIDHQRLLGKKLIYGVVEAPEHSVMVRGKLSGTNTITLPDEWEWLVDHDSITVHLTSIGRHQELFVQEILSDRIIIGSDMTINCFYTVQATRKDVDPLVTVE